MGLDVKDNRIGGRKFADVWEIFQGVHEVSPPIWLGDVGGDPLHWQDIRGVTT